MQEENVSERDLEMKTDEKTTYNLLNRLIVDNVVTDVLQSTDLLFMRIHNP